MLIKQAERWQRDPGIKELIEHFDQEKYSIDPSCITHKEASALAEEIRKCQESFEYASRNYFWIVDKEGTDRPFTLWESQELILDKIYRLKRRNKAQKLMILKARQLGCSTVIEGLIAWRSMFFPNVNAMVVSHVPKHAAYLYGIMLHIYDQLPWWMQPMLSSRKEEDGLVFKNPDAAARRFDPGLNSMVMVAAANQVSGVGEGYKLNAVHASEYASWDPDRAREIIDGDMVHALAENVGTFAVLESTAKGAGTFAEELWIANIELAERADWNPLFLPWFFESTRVTAPEGGWRPPDKEVAMRERITDEWVSCTNCGEYRERHFKGEDIAANICEDCKIGTMQPVILSDEQLAWMWEKRINAERRGPESIKELKQELCATSEEAFQISGFQVFPQDTQDWVNLTVRDPLYNGNLDDKGRLHCAVKQKDGEFKCFQEWCKTDHRWDAELPLRIWELPEETGSYVIGVDVAEGMGGKADFSVAWVNKIGRAPNADVHVATYRSNVIDPAHFAAPVNWLGRFYNEALIAVEYNNYQTTGDLLRIWYQYPNLFRWKHYDSVKGLESNKWHWITQINTKPKLWQTAISWLRSQLWVVRDEIFAHEIKRFQKEEYDSKSASAEKMFHDDVVIAGMIALYTSHDLDWDESATSDSPLTGGPVGVLQSMAWHMKCRRTNCGHEWPAHNPEEYSQCPSCGCRIIGGKPTTDEAPSNLGFDSVSKDMLIDTNSLDTLPETVADY